MPKYYNDRDPINGRLQKMMSDQAAVKMWQKHGESKNEKDVPMKEPKPMRIMVLLIICFVALYLGCMILTTNLVQGSYEEKFEKNLNGISDYITANLDEDMIGCLNGIYNTEYAKDTYQYFSAAIYDADGKQLTATGQYLSLAVEDEMYYFPLTDYFNEAEIEKLLFYARASAEKYIIEAKIDGESKHLISIQIDSRSNSTDKQTVWEWTNPDVTAYDEQQVITFWKKTRMENIISAPYYDREKLYEYWTNDEFLQGFTDTVDVDAKSPATTETNSFLEKQVTHTKKVMVEDEVYWISVHSTTESLQAAMDFLSPVYVVGFVITMIGVYVTVVSLNKFRKR